MGGGKKKEHIYLKEKLNVFAKGRGESYPLEQIKLLKTMCVCVSGWGIKKRCGQGEVPKHPQHFSVSQC